MPDGACKQDGGRLQLVCGHKAHHPLKGGYDHHLLPVFNIGKLLCECLLEQRRQVFDDILTLFREKKTDSPPVILSFFSGNVSPGLKALGDICYGCLA